VLDATGTRRLAVLSVVGCAYDESPLPPWGRAVTAPGASRCVLEVTWGSLVGQPLSYPAALDPAWVDGGKMVVPRNAHAATRLADGRVLVAGGWTAVNSNTYVNAVELFDPATKTWAATTPMKRPRGHFSVITLASGKVLAAAGDDQLLATAETFDPATATWTATDAMKVARDGGSATLLGDGRVLVAGGCSAYSSTCDKLEATSETYDPATDSWTLSLSSMSVAREAYAMVTLGDGSALAAGGCPMYGANFGCFTSTKAVDRYEKCCAELTTCKNSPDCAVLYACFDECGATMGSFDCLLKCASTCSPAGYGDFKLALYCVSQTTCPAECASNKGSGASTCVGAGGAGGAGGSGSAGQAGGAGAAGKAGGGGAGAGAGGASAGAGGTGVAGSGNAGAAGVGGGAGGSTAGGAGAAGATTGGSAGASSGNGGSGPGTGGGGQGTGGSAGGAKSTGGQRRREQQRGKQRNDHRCRRIGCRGHVVLHRGRCGDRRLGDRRHGRCGGVCSVDRRRRLRVPCGGASSRARVGARGVGVGHCGATSSTGLGLSPIPAGSRRSRARRSAATAVRDERRPPTGLDESPPIVDGSWVGRCRLEDTM
jgi:hypothetical protein